MSHMHQRDAAFIHDFEPLALADYEFLRYSNERSVRDAFLSGAIEEPHLVYGDIELARIGDRLDDVAALSAVIETVHDEFVRRAYLPKLEETKTKYEMLGAALAGDDRGAHEASVKLYGSPRMDVFHYSQRFLRERLEIVQNKYGPNDVRIQNAYEVLEKATAGIPDHQFPFEDIVFPEPIRFADEPPLSADEIRERCLDALGDLSIEGWQVVIDAPGERVTFNTDHERRTVFIPSDADLLLRKYPLRSEQVDALIAHEIGTHVARREHGTLSPLALLGIGLAGYLRGEEGVATYVEQVKNGTRHFAGGMCYLVTGWAMGLDGTPRTFRESYELLLPYFFISMTEHALTYNGEPDLDLLYDRAKHRAWARCIRTYRGTTGKSAGMCFTKDIVYREGNIAIWELVTKNPSAAETFMLGKFDPANKEHVQLLRDLGMIAEHPVHSISH